MAREIVLALCVLLAVAPSTSAAEPKTSATAEVEAMMNQVVKAYETKDIATFTRITAHDPDMVCFGTDAAERWVGWEQLRASSERQLAALEKVKLTAHDRVIKVSRAGDAAWVSELWDMDVVSGGQPANFKNMRVTSVLEKRQGHWLFVHSHASIGVAGQAVKY
jgi:uncharacterized protein (TIGR02246 family)